MKITETKNSSGFSNILNNQVVIILRAVGDSKDVKDHFLLLTMVCGQDLKEVITYISK